MKEQLTQYVSLLFAGVPDAQEQKEKATSHALDRYDALIAQGKTPQEAYNRTVAGIGDIRHVLHRAHIHPFHPGKAAHPDASVLLARRRILRAAAVCLYICSPLPLAVLSQFGKTTLGLCGLLCLLALATALMLIAGGHFTLFRHGAHSDAPSDNPRSKVHNCITIIGIVTYLALTFLTQVWHITWLVFPIMAATHGLVNACLDLKEANSHEA